jgi:anti-sigma regulatory factor (Ser/Thr protein kinase)
MSDRGVPFDPLSRDEPALADSLRDRPVGGLGLFLIRQLTSSLTYRRDDGRNRVRFEISASSDD